MAADETSGRLFVRARQGDASALGRLLDRYLPDLRRWTHRRLPRWARTAADTSDFVQDAMLGTIRRFGTFEPKGRQALAEYLRTAVQNRLRDEFRRVARRGRVFDNSFEVRSRTAVDPQPSPLDLAADNELKAKYRAAVLDLNASDRVLIVAHLAGYSDDQLAVVTGRSPNAVRVAVQRALRRLLKVMRDG